MPTWEVPPALPPLVITTVFCAPTESILSINTVNQQPEFRLDVTFLRRVLYWALAVPVFLRQIEFLNSISRSRGLLLEIFS